MKFLSWLRVFCKTPNYELHHIESGCRHSRSFKEEIVSRLPQLSLPQLPFVLGLGFLCKSFRRMAVEIIGRGGGLVHLKLCLFRMRYFNFKKWFKVIWALHLKTLPFINSSKIQMTKTLAAMLDDSNITANWNFWLMVIQHSDDDISCKWSLGWWKLIISSIFMKKISVSIRLGSQCTLYTSVLPLECVYNVHLQRKFNCCWLSIVKHYFD